MPETLATDKSVKLEAVPMPATPLTKIPIYKPFGPLVKELRLSRKLNLEVVAKAVRSHRGYISGIENRKVPPPSPRFISRLALFFKVDEKDLLLLAYAEKAPKLIREYVMQALWPTPPKDPNVS